MEKTVAVLAGEIAALHLIVEQLAVAVCLRAPDPAGAASALRDALVARCRQPRVGGSILIENGSTTAEGLAGERPVTGMLAALGTVPPDTANQIAAGVERAIGKAAERITARVDEALVVSG